MQVIAYDFETTGIDAKTCEPLQFAAVTVDIRETGRYDILDKRVEYLTIRAAEVPEGAYNVHGISKEKTVQHGVDPLIALPAISGTVLGYNNLRYDDVILARYGGDIQNSIDLFKGAQRLKKQGLLESATLSSTYKTLTGKEPDNAHDALADVIMTLDLIYPMMKVLEVSTFTAFLNLLNKAFVNIHMRMPFGKHKGRKLSEIAATDRKYLEWLQGGDFVNGDLRVSLEAVLK
jgi:exonuclease I